jgi:hypothetical protein
MHIMLGSISLDAMESAVNKGGKSTSGSSRSALTLIALSTGPYEVS